MKLPTPQSPTGYLSSLYAESLAELGTPLHLPHSGTWILKRLIPATEYYDASGLYPLFCCEDWSKLSTDLGILLEESPLVSLTVVTDPFGSFTTSQIAECFPHLVRPFKNHLITRSNCAPDQIASKHHRYYARRALRRVSVDVCKPDDSFLEEWWALYQGLIKRHGITGTQAFSKSAFQQQMQVPGLVAFKAVAGGQTVSAHLWYSQDRVAYSHLAASSASGYKLGASYGLYWSAIEYFRGKVDYMDLGAAADRSASDGLSRFKQGWATSSRKTFLCGRIFEGGVYQDLATREPTNSTYFPAYRAAGSTA